MAETVSQTLISSWGELSLLSLPETLNGCHGINRALNKPAIKARTDLEAIQCWLAEYSNKPTTYKNYRIDAERLLLWAIVERGKPLSGLESDDLLAYSNFLDDPKPVEKWCSSKTQSKNRWEQGWKPFRGPLSLTAKLTCFANLTSLFNYLVEMDYLSRNPFKSIRRQIKQERDLIERTWQVQGRILGMDEWEAIQSEIEVLPENDAIEKIEKIRLKFLIGLLFFAGLRVDELTHHAMGDFKKIHDYRAQKDRWWLYIKGKGDKHRKIPVNQSLLSILLEYRKGLGLSDYPEKNENEPLVRSIRATKSISARRVNQLLKGLGIRAARKFEKYEPEKAQKLQKISAHWFRHLSFSMQDLVNIRKQHIKENAGHASERTTDIYVHAVDNLRHEEMEKLTWSISILD